MQCILGVDGGNTKTIALVAALDGTILGAGRGGCGDIYNAEAGTAWPDSAAAAIANIQVMRDLELVARSQATGKVLAAHLRELGENHPSVGDVRSMGLFGAVELVRNRETREPMAPFNGTSPEMTALRRFLLDRGLYVYIHWNTVLIVPPLIITEAELAEGIAILNEGLRITDQAVNPS